MLEMIEISSCLRNLLECVNFPDMKLVLHMLSSIRRNYQHIREKSLTIRIADVKSDTNDLDIKYNRNLDEVFDMFAQFYDRFVERDMNTGEISRLIRCV